MLYLSSKRLYAISKGLEELIKNSNNPEEVEYCMELNDVILAETKIKEREEEKLKARIKKLRAERAKESQ